MLKSNCLCQLKLKLHFSLSIQTDEELNTLPSVLHVCEIETRSSELESERARLQQEVKQLLQFAQLSQDEKDGLLVELESKKQEISEQASRIQSAEQRHAEATQHITRLEETVDLLEQQVQASHDKLVEELKPLKVSTQQQLEAQQQQIAQMFEELTTMKLHLVEATKKESELDDHIEELNLEKSRLVQENNTLKRQISQLVSSTSNEKSMLEANLNALKGELQCKQKTVEESQQKMQHMESELVDLIAPKSSLETKMDKLTSELTCLEEENRRVEGAHKEQLEQFERRTVHHNDRIIHLHFEKYEFEQMYLQFREAYVETENELQVERKLARHEMEAKEKQISRMVDSLRQEKEDAKRNNLSIKSSWSKKRSSKWKPTFNLRWQNYKAGWRTWKTNLKAKLEEVVKLTAPADALKLQLETAVEEKEAMERDINGRISVLEDRLEADVSFISNFNFFTIIINIY